MPEPLRILAIGAHPDDCDYRVGGMAVKYARLGHRVKFVSLTNGNAGHFAMGGASLARRRQDEAQRSAAIAGIEYQLLDINDAEIMPTLENRWVVVRLIREFRPDLIVTNRPNDYHPDHRYTSQLVADAAYTVTIPNVQSLTPHLPANPVIAYWEDDFRRPYPFAPDVVVAIDDVADVKIDMLHCHQSQFYEWIPYNQGRLHEVPDDDAGRRAILAQWRLAAARADANDYRDLVLRLYGPERGAAVQYIEALEFCEYGAKVTPEVFARLFPFFD